MLSTSAIFSHLIDFTSNKTINICKVGIETLTRINSTNLINCGGQQNPLNILFQYIRISSQIGLGTLILMFLQISHICNPPLERLPFHHQH